MIASSCFFSPYKLKAISYKLSSTSKLLYRLLDDTDEAVDAYHDGHTDKPVDHVLLSGRARLLIVEVPYELHQTPYEHHKGDGEESEDDGIDDEVAYPVEKVIH